ncbi:hypothetical protein AAG570_004390 [Ranatra chinensis]|uniref:Uncharacterized protein n=1 Tax=Ranatra chinensis TaxID=642074 RepID=A0ABD0Y0Q0_9HEMI
MASEGQNMFYRNKKQETTEIGVSCNQYQFACDNMCLAYYKKCDGYSDCSDSRDEAPSTCQNQVPNCSNEPCGCNMLPSNNLAAAPCIPVPESGATVAAMAPRHRVTVGNILAAVLFLWSVEVLSDSIKDIGLEPIDCSAQTVVFKCDSKCIPQIWTCDGQYDCDDHTDEGPFCKELEDKPCAEGYFRCGYICRPLFWRCDAVPDCPDGVDEEPQMCERHEKELNCTDVQFRCANRCITTEWVCDGDKDCPGGKDEHDDLCAKN